jgi:O-antigen ligase
MKNSINNIWKDSSVLEKILYIYIAFIPFSDLGYLHFGTKRIGWTEFIFLGLFILWALEYVRGKIRLRKTLLEFPIVSMLVLFSASFFNSKNLLDSMIEMSGLIYLVMFFYLICTIISNQQKLQNLLNMVFISGTIIALAGLIIFAMALVTGETLNNLFLHYTKIESLAHCFPRIKFAFESPNMMLSYLHFVLIISIILFLLEKRGRRKFLIALSISILLLTSFLTGSRSFTGLLLSLLMVQLWFSKDRVVSFLKYLTIAGFIFFLIASIIKTIWIVFPLEIRKDNDKKLIELKADYAYSIHFIRPVASINMFKKHPLIGVGFGTYNRNFRDNIDWDWFRQSFDFNGYPNYLFLAEKKALNFDPHSVFLGALAETGLLGSLGLMCFFIGYAMLLAKGFTRSKEHGFQSIVCGCVLAGFIGFLLNGMILDILSLRHLWIMMAIGAAVFYIKERPLEC